MNKNHSIEAEVNNLMSSVPRRFYVDEVYNTDQMHDVAVPIGCGVNTTKPKQIARMLSLLGKRGKVLEIGTGCGWQTALLSNLSDKVYSIEVSKRLYERAKFNLNGLNIALKNDNGLNGWADHALFDGIIVCAAIESVNDNLIMQLNDNGVIIAPIGNEKDQVLHRMTKKKNGLVVEKFEKCGFIAAERQGT